jgi:DHA1 family bicyclomycin/chloramphenicol resistance-like MFS transporter
MPYPRWLPLLLGYLQAVGPMSIDMYLPAFPSIEADFHAAPGAAQMTLATWILGLSMGQLVQGSLADRFGRRVPLLIGTATYTAASFGCALAPSIAWLSFWRFIAAFGGSASMIVPRAVVRDVAEGHDAARMMSRLILILGVAPVLAPSIGGLVLTFANWRVIFWIVGAYGCIGLVLAACFLPDTLPESRRVRLHAGSMLLRWSGIVRERVFITNALMVSFATFSLFAYLGGSPTVFIVHFHLLPGQFAVVFGAVAAVYVLCSQLNVVLTRLLGLSRTLTITSTFYLLCALSVLAVAATHTGGPVLMAALLAVTQGLTGFLSPTATVSALTRHAAHAGSASAVLGTLQFLIGCSSGFMIALATNGTPLPMACLMAVGAVSLKVADVCRPKLGHEGRAKAKLP